MKPVLHRLLGWAGLILLLGAQCAAGLLPLGGLGMPIALGLVIGMVLLIALLFMDLWSSPVLARIFALAGLFWLLILFALAGTDYLTRIVYPVSS